MPVGLGTEEFELKGSGNEESAHEFAQGSGVFQIHQASKRGYTEGIVIIIEEDRPINHHHDVTNRYRDQGWAILGEMKRQGQSDSAAPLPMKLYNIFVRSNRSTSVYEYPPRDDMQPMVGGQDAHCSAPKTLQRKLLFPIACSQTALHRPSVLNGESISPPHASSINSA